MAPLQSPNSADCLTPVVFTQPDVTQLVVNPLAGQNIATLFLDYANIPTLLLQADLGSGTYMNYQVQVDSNETKTDGCFDTVAGTTKDASIPGKTLNEGNNTVAVYGLCAGVYTIQLSSCRDSDQTCGNVYPSSTQPKIYYQQPSLADAASLVKLAQYTSTKNATYDKTKEAYSLISEWASSNCITTAQMQTEFCKSASNIMNMGLAQYINLLQSNYQSTEATILAQITKMQAAGPATASAVAPAQNTPCTSQADILPVTSAKPIAPGTWGLAEVMNTSFIAGGAALAIIGTIMWAAGDRLSSKATAKVLTARLATLDARLAVLEGGVVDVEVRSGRTSPVQETYFGQRAPLIVAERATPSAPPSKAKGIGGYVGILGVGVAVIGVVLSSIPNFSALAAATNSSENERALALQLGKISAELKQNISNENNMLGSLVSERTK